MPYLFDPTINLLSFLFSAGIGVVFGYSRPVASHRWTLSRHSGTSEAPYSIQLMSPYHCQFLSHDFPVLLPPMHADFCAGKAQRAIWKLIITNRIVREIQVGIIIRNDLIDNLRIL